MTAYRTVAVAGATGNLGPALTKELVDAGFDVTILSRSGKKPVGITAEVKVVTVDYTSEANLASALKGQDAIVSVLPDHNAQKPLIDAAIAAGVKRFLPSEYGGNVAGNPKVAALPVFQGKKTTQEYLQSKADAISYTSVVTGAFLDWGLETGFVLKVTSGPTWCFPEGGPAKIFGSGDNKISTTLLSDIGKAVAGVLRNPEETKNRAVYVQSAAVSQNQLLDIIEEAAPGAKPQTETVAIEDLTRQGYELLQKGDIMPAMVNFLWTSTWGEGYDGVWPKNDNELLGVKELSAQELAELVKHYLSTNTTGSFTLQ